MLRRSVRAVAVQGLRGLEDLLELLELAVHCAISCVRADLLCSDLRLVLAAQMKRLVTLKLWRRLLPHLPMEKTNEDLISSTASASGTGVTISYALLEISGAKKGSAVSLPGSAVRMFWEIFAPAPCNPLPGTPARKLRAFASVALGTRRDKILLASCAALGPGQEMVSMLGGA